MPTLFLAASLAMIALAERSSRLRFEQRHFLRSYFATDAFCLATGALALGLALQAGAVRAASAWGVLLPRLADWPAPVVVLAALVLHDLGAYAAHGWMHRSDVLWRFHKVHHSSRSLDWLATFRAHLVEHALRHLLSPVALLLMGFPLYAVAAASAFHGAWAALAHSNLGIDLGFLEPLFITPRLHRLHHVSQSADHNLGVLFSLWDRLRGRLIAGRDAPLSPLGVPGEEDSYPQTWGRQQLEPLRGMRMSRWGMPASSNTGPSAV